MANVSEATGVLTIIAKTDEKEFVRFQEALSRYLESSLYGADFDAEDVFDQNADGTCSVEINFNGRGRWNFDRNLRNFGLWAKNSGCETLKKLKGISFKLVFDFVDHEDGAKILYTETASVEHKANEPWESCQYTEIEQEDLDYTVDNLVNYHVFNKYSIIEVGDVKALRDFIGKEADDFNDSDLKRYISDHRGEFLHDWQISDVIDEMKEY